MKSPKGCDNITDVRNAIDELDKQIISLLGKRFKYVKEVVRFKEKTEASIVAKERKEAVLKSRRKMAEKNGLNPDIIEDVYTCLINHFIEEELNIINNNK